MFHTFPRKNKKTVNTRVEDYLIACYWLDNFKIISVYKEWKDSRTVEYKLKVITK